MGTWVLGYLGTLALEVNFTVELVFFSDAVIPVSRPCEGRGRGMEDEGNDGNYGDVWCVGRDGARAAGG